MAENIIDTRASDSRFWRHHQQRKDAAVKALRIAADWLERSLIPSPTDITVSGSAITVIFHDIQSLAFVRTVIEGVGLLGTWEFSKNGFHLIANPDFEVWIQMENQHLTFDPRELVKLLEVQ